MMKTVSSASQLETACSNSVGSLLESVSSFASLTTTSGLLTELTKLSEAGVALSSRIYSLEYGGQVPRDGNCLFDSLAVAMGSFETASEVRARCVSRAMNMQSSSSLPEGVEQRIANLYAPNLKNCWGIECVQEHKVIVKTDDLPQAQQEIQSRLDSGLDYNTAASTVYTDLGRPVNDLDSWADYQAIEGCMEDEHAVVSLQYVEEGLLTVDIAEGQGAFGDDLAIEILATEYQREIFVVQAHGGEGSTEEDPTLFFLPHRPIGQDGKPGQPLFPPLFLLMKGSDWRGAGADHYEPLLASKRACEEGAEPYINLDDIWSTTEAAQR